jgi:adenylate cyclase
MIRGEVFSSSSTAGHLTSEPRRRLATIMFTDMVGYSKLTQRSEALALELLEEHRRLLRPIFSAHSGREIEAAGDGFFVEFASALDAVQCAIDIQETLSRRNASAALDKGIQVRIGLHLGDVVVRENRVHGDGVNIAARIEPLAAPGGICLSEDVARQIQNKIELPLVELGRGELKNIRLPVDIYSIALPWQPRHGTFAGQVAFTVRRKTVRRVAVGAIAVAVAALSAAGIAGIYVWPRACQKGVRG